MSVCLSAAGWDNTGLRPRDIGWRVGGIYCLAFLLLGVWVYQGGRFKFFCFFDLALILGDANVCLLLLLFVVGFYSKMCLL